MIDAKTNDTSESADGIHLLCIFPEILIVRFTQVSTDLPMLLLSMQRQRCLARF